MTARRWVAATDDPDLDHDEVLAVDGLIDAATEANAGQVSTVYTATDGRVLRSITVAKLTAPRRWVAVLVDADGAILVYERRRR